MGDAMETLQSSDTVDLDTIRSRIKELRDIHGSSNDVPELRPSDSERLLKDCALQLESKINQVLSEFSDIGSLASEDLDAYLGKVKEELNSVESENVRISNEIEDLTRSYIKDSSQLEIELEGLNCSLDCIASLGTEKGKADGYVDCSSDGEVALLNAKADYKFKMLELSHQIEEHEITLSSLQNLDGILKRFEAIEKIEDALTGLKVIEYEGNCIRLSLKTCIPNSESLLFQHKIEDIAESLEQNHELIIEVVEGTLDLKSVEIFPNDVCIGELIDAAKSFRQLFPDTSMLETRSSLEWFIRRVQDRIVLCTLRRLLVNFANKSRHSFEYLDRAEIIVAHMVGGVDASFKMAQGWPVSNHALKLISLKRSSQYSKEISLSFLGKVEEVANSLDAHMRQNILSFVDAIEEMLMQRMNTELQSDISSEN
ncbi:uncharacterized protein LOC114288709 [Camellia sinensis]|uniref:uncharacterized protein LOC114288709 n=1 Tax=Camellia sinensis TaxID=4442 RepID=UPI001035B1A7|nr:uncharacterized protein LOC114288709 [Camellia sinensis]XP_028088077.1 uncharacterized protein LOC114288709 [Camellia sinensis]XP_028088078.1 uncharacterized protein LOC114288709 [Camellia sinensis]XP_028088079.1 uncharacterized protein LOC114288709 [Camellia sinensis]XP_028088080.1 uncharacterized protein LOC114288709 [Camellia sinensis]